MVGLDSSTTSPTYPRYRPPKFRAFRIHPPLRFLRTTGDPRGTFMLPVSPRYRQLPLRTPPLYRLPSDDTSPGTATASVTAYVGDADHPTQLFNSPPTDRIQTTTGPSAFLYGSPSDELSNPSSPAPRRSALGRHRPSLAQFGTPPRPTIAQGIVFNVFFCPSVKRFFRRPNVPSSVDTQRVPLRFPTRFPFLMAHL